MASHCLVLRAGQQARIDPDTEVLQAFIGEEPGSAVGENVDCTAEVQDQLGATGCIVTSSNGLGLTLAHGKVLSVELSGGDGRPPRIAEVVSADDLVRTGITRGRVLMLNESERLRWSFEAAVTIDRAWYGNPARPWKESKGCGGVCTETVIGQLRGGDRILAENELLPSDPCPGVGKVLLVEFNDEFVATSPAAALQQAAKPRLFKSPEEVPSFPRWVAFVRHAQAGHNVDRALLDHPDNPLTDEGCAQAVAARDRHAGAAVRDAELVITSPLKRAMQTTGLLLGDSSTRVLVDALGTERRAATCDQGTPKSELLANLPQECSRDWEGWDTLPEHWSPEPGEDKWGRAEAFVEALKQRPEDRIACVGHGAFWQMVLGEYLPNCEVVFCERFMSP